MHRLSAMVRNSSAVSAVGKCLLLAVALMMLAPSTADARLFTVCNLTTCPPQGSVLSFNDGAGTFGTINPVLDISGTVGNVVGAAGPANFNNDFFIFDLTLGAGSNAVDQITVSLNKQSGAPIGEPYQTGYFSTVGGSGGAQLPNGTTAPHTAEITNDPLIQIFPFPIGTGTSSFDFDWGGSSAGNITSGETTVRLFVVMSSPTALLEFDTVTFMISPVGASDFTVQGEIIPEPATMLLLGTGLVALGVGERRRRRKGARQGKNAGNAPEMRP